MSRPVAGSSSLSNLIPPHASESKRDRKRRETINKIEVLHDESWRNREERFQALWREYHAENRAVNAQPPTSANYLLRLYPKTIERDALLEQAEIEYQYKCSQARKMYQNERDTIEAQYNDAREQIVQRFLFSLDERRRKLREEKEGGDVISEGLLENAMKPKVKRRKLFSHRTPSSSRFDSPASGPSRGLASVSPDEYAADGTKSNDLLLNGMLPLALATVSVDDILTPNSTSLVVAPPLTGPAYPPAPGKRGPRGKAGQAQADTNGVNGNDKDSISAAPGTLTALAIASGQQQPAQPKTSRGAGAQGQWVLGKSLADLSKMTSASQLEIESDWARIQGTTGRGRRNRAD